MNSFFKSKYQEVLFLGITLLAFITFYIETDIYTPSFPEMVTYFKTNEDAIQMLLSMNFLGLCISSLFFGPASDAYGRKSVLCTGLSIFMLGSIGCALTDSLSLMILYRFLQGVGCGAIVSSGLATIFDVYPAERSSRLVSILNGAVSGVMALAPMLGNWISLHMGWRMNFYLIAVLAIITVVCTAVFTKETLPKEKRNKLNPSSIFKNYGFLLLNFPFMAHSVIWCLMFSVVIVFISNLSLIFVDHLHVAKEVFGYYQASIMAAFFVGSMGAAYLIKKIGMMTTKMIGSLFYLLGIFTLGVLSFFSIDSPQLLITTMTLASFGSALSMTIYFTYSMFYIGENLTGSAMSFTQSFRLLMTSGLVWIAASLFDGSTKPMSLLAILSTASCLGLYVMLYIRNQHLAPATRKLEI
jgi:DHA1 family bicyclomycin/chloramphenicol resistance-like MFS transporter